MITLTIGGNDFLPQLKQNPIEITERLNDEANVARFNIQQKPGQSKPNESSEVIIVDPDITGSPRIFAGYITRVEPEETNKGDYILHEVEVSDYTYILNNKNAQITYENETLGDIVRDLIDRYVDSSYGVTYMNVVASGPTITSVSFGHIPLKECFKKLSKITGYSWYIDYYKDVHFFLTENNPAPESFSDNSTNLSEVRIDRDTTQVRNVITVEGGMTQSAGTVEYEVTGDDSTGTYFMESRPKEIASFTVNGSPATYGYENLVDEESVDWIVNFSAGSVRNSSARGVLSSAETLNVQYYEETPILIKYRGEVSIAAMAALEGGDGEHDYFIEDDTITTREEALDRAIQEVEDFGNPLIIGEINTRSGLLSDPENIFRQGQLITINFPTWGISTDTTYPLREVIIRILPKPDETPDVEYEYSLRFGGRLIGVKEFIEALYENESVPGETEDFNKIFGVGEAIGIQESASRTNSTPPFQWGSFTWGKAEWGT